VWTKTCITSDVELKKKDLYGGPTGVFALIFTEFVVVVANVGDSRCTLVQDDRLNRQSDRFRSTTNQTTRWNSNVSQTLARNLKTRKATSACVVMDETDRMSVSRAFGDFECKENDKLGPEGQAVSCIPDFIAHKQMRKIYSLFLPATVPGTSCQMKTSRTLSLNR
jgi:serine/threonine protein phosphatase PrpC